MRNKHNRRDKNRQTHFSSFLLPNANSLAKSIWLNLTLIFIQKLWKITKYRSQASCSEFSAIISSVLSLDPRITLRQSKWKELLNRNPSMVFQPSRERYLANINTDILLPIIHVCSLVQLIVNCIQMYFCNSGLYSNKDFTKHISSVYTGPLIAKCAYHCADTHHFTQLLGQHSRLFHPIGPQRISAWHKSSTLGSAICWHGN